MLGFLRGFQITYVSEDILDFHKLDWSAPQKLTDPAAWKDQTHGHAQHLYRSFPGKTSFFLCVFLRSMFGEFRAFPKTLTVLILDFGASSAAVQLLAEVTRFTASKHLGTLLAQKGFCFIKGSLQQAGQEAVQQFFQWNIPGLVEALASGHHGQGEKDLINKEAGRIRLPG